MPWGRSPRPHAVRHQAPHRRLEVVVAHHAAGDARRAGRDAALVDNENVLAAALAGRAKILRQMPGARKPVNAGADDDVVIIVGGGGHGLATAYYLAKNHGITQRRRAREGLARRRQYRAQHHHRPLQLPAARQHLVLRALPEAVGGAVSRDLNFNVMFSQRGIVNLCHTDAQMDEAATRRGNAMRLQRHRRRAARPPPGAGHGAAARLFARAASRRGRPGAAARRHRPPRRGRLGLCPRRRPRRVDIIQNCEVTGFLRDGERIVGVETTRGEIRAEKVGDRGRRQHRTSRRQGGPAPADREPRAAGLRVGAAQAADRHGRHLRRRPPLRLPVRQGRPGLRRRHRRLQLLRPARQPAGGRGRGLLRLAMLPGLSRACACCAPGAASWT
jgi:hypothetical protein